MKCRLFVFEARLKTYEYYITLICHPQSHGSGYKFVETAHEKLPENRLDITPNAIEL